VLVDVAGGREVKLLTELEVLLGLEEPVNQRVDDLAESASSLVHGQSSSVPDVLEKTCLDVSKVFAKP